MKKLKSKKIIWAWRLILLLGSTLIVAHILLMYYAPYKDLVLTYNFSAKPLLISEFTPSGRVLDREQNVTNGEYYQRLVAEPAYFTADIPKRYQQAEVTFEYQNPEQSIIQLGINLQYSADQFTPLFQPLQNKYLEESTWPTIENEKYVLYQKIPNYKSVEDFLAHPPANAKTGTWLEGFDVKQIDEQYQAAHTGIVVDHPIRGTHHLFTYIKNQPLKFTFKYYDINNLPGEDPFWIQLKRNGEIIEETKNPDDGEIGIATKSTGEKTIEFRKNNLQEGVYELDLSVSDDIIITHIETDQDKLVFKDRVHLAGTKDYETFVPNINTEPSTLYTSANYITAIAKHPVGVEPLEMYNGTFDIATVNVPYTWDNPIFEQPHHFTAKHNDIDVYGDRPFSFSEDNWFDPFFGRYALNQYTNVDRLDYMITKKYTPPGKKRSWYTASTTFDLTKINRSEISQLQFIVSAPGLPAASQGIKVRNLTIRASKPSTTLWNILPKLKQKILQ